MEYVAAAHNGILDQLVNSLYYPKFDLWAIISNPKFKGKGAENRV